MRQLRYSQNKNAQGYMEIAGILLFGVPVVAVMLALAILRWTFIAVLYIVKFVRDHRKEPVEAPVGPLEAAERDAGLVWDGDTLLDGYGPYDPQGQTVRLG